VKESAVPAAEKITGSRRRSLAADSKRIIGKKQEEEEGIITINGINNKGKPMFALVSLIFLLQMLPSQNTLL